MHNAGVAIVCGADVKIRQKQLSRATASIALDVYVGLWSERPNEVADAVDQMRLKAIDTDNSTEFHTVAYAIILTDGCLLFEGNRFRV